jgi:hypothetical protein
MLRKNCLLVFVILLIAGCSSQTVEVNHFLTYSAKGTRSEARHGHLIVNGKEMPWAFKQIAVNGKSYSLHFRSNLWGDDGYHPDGVVLVPEKGDETVASETLEKGYWLGAERPENIPQHWLFVTWGQRSSAFVAPGAIDKLIKEQDIPVAPMGEIKGRPMMREW